MRIPRSQSSLLAAVLAGAGLAHAAGIPAQQDVVVTAGRSGLIETPMLQHAVDWAVHAIETLLYSISTMLYLPVLLALAGLALYLMTCLGGFAGEWLERRRGIRRLIGSAEARMAAAVAASDGEPALDARLECIVQKAEADGLRRLDAVRFVVKVGPALGLMGTLIPMGISLAGLAQGNLPKMAESMTTAFTATVVGLACSVAAYLLTLTREHWLRIDVTDIAFAAETMLRRHAPDTARAAHIGG